MLYPQAPLSRFAAAASGGVPQAAFNAAFCALQMRSDGARAVFAGNFFYGGVDIGDAAVHRWMDQAASELPGARAALTDTVQRAAMEPLLGTVERRGTTGLLQTLALPADGNGAAAAPLHASPSPMKASIRA